MSTTTSRAVRLTGLLVGAALLAGCSMSMAPVVGRPTLTASVPIENESAPLAGEALGQRKLEMRRAARDLVHFGATVETLRLRRDGALRDFQDFMESYVDVQVEPLLVGNESSEDPEVAVLDAQLRLVKADLLIETRDFWTARDVINEIEDIYGARTSMLVDYPVGRQSTLAEAIAYLHERNKGMAGHWVAGRPSS